MCMISAIWHHINLGKLLKWLNRFFWGGKAKPNEGLGSTLRLHDHFGKPFNGRACDQCLQCRQAIRCWVLTPLLEVCKYRHHSRQPMIEFVGWFICLLKLLGVYVYTLIYTYIWWVWQKSSWINLYFRVQHVNVEVSRPESYVWLYF